MFRGWGRPLCFGILTPLQHSQRLLARRLKAPRTRRPIAPALLWRGHASNYELIQPRLHSGQLGRSLLRGVELEFEVEHGGRAVAREALRVHPLGGGVSRHIRSRRRRDHIRIINWQRGFYGGFNRGLVQSIQFGAVRLVDRQRGRPAMLAHFNLSVFIAGYLIAESVPRFAVDLARLVKQDVVDGFGVHGLDCAVEGGGPPLDGFGGRACHFQLQGFVGIVGGQREAPRWRACGLIAQDFHAADERGVV